LLRQLPEQRQVFRARVAMSVVAAVAAAAEPDAVVKSVAVAEEKRASEAR
jgi:hypothetical protein